MEVKIRAFVLFCLLHLKIFVILSSSKTFVFLSSSSKNFVIVSPSSKIIMFSSSKNFVSYCLLHMSFSCDCVSI